MSRLLADRYRVAERIGTGGSAVVHAGIDEHLGRPVAIKMLDGRAAADADPAGRGRFLREARTAASFVHPNAVTTFDAGEDDDTLFMVMELVEGPTLAAHLAGGTGPLPVVDALAIADQVLAALAAAHEQGIVHRDVKPANILVTADGCAKLADFGIARRFDDLDAALTGTGLVLGTPRYLTPEQVQGKPTGPATDVYAAGLLLFEMLSGEVPLVGDTPAATAVIRQTQSVPDLRELRPEVPKAVVRVVERALARHADSRFADAGAFRSELRRAVGYDGRTAPLPFTVRTPALVATTRVLAGGLTASMSQVETRAGAVPDVDGPPTRATPVRNRWATHGRSLLAAAAVVLLGFAVVATGLADGDLAELAAGVEAEGADSTGADPLEEAVAVSNVAPASGLWDVVAQMRARVRDGLVASAVAEEVRLRLDAPSVEPVEVEPVAAVEGASHPAPAAPRHDDGPPRPHDHAERRGPPAHAGRGGPPPGRGPDRP